MRKKEILSPRDYTELIDFSDMKLTALQAIKLKCIECCAFNYKEAKKCDIKTCALNQFITKKREYRITEEERERRRKNFNIR